MPNIKLMANWNQRRKSKVTVADIQVPLAFRHKWSEWTTVVTDSGLDSRREMMLNLPMYCQPMVWMCHRPLDQDMHQFRVVRAGHVPACEEDGNPIQPWHRIITVTELLHKGNNSRAVRSCRCTAVIVQVHGIVVAQCLTSLFTTYVSKTPFGPSS